MPAEDMPRRAANGEYLISDQIRIPLLGVASLKTVLPDGAYLYEAFIFHNPLVRAFIKTDTSNTIIAVALADLLDIKDGSRVTGVVPRITEFYRTPLPPIDIQTAAIRRMQEYYSRFGPDTLPDGNDIRVFTGQLSGTP
jgi:hypothetical protein